MIDITILKYIFFSLCCIFGIIFIIFILRKDENDIDYNKIISKLNEEQENNLKRINAGNKKINQLESEILKYKKKLGLKLFK